MRLALLQALSWLLSVPGASNTLLEVSVPYSRDSLVELLGAVSECRQKASGLLND